MIRIATSNGPLHSATHSDARKTLSIGKKGVSTVCEILIES